MNVQDMEQVDEDDLYAYVIITAYGMGNDAYGADACNYCDEKIEYVDSEWRHYDDETTQCTVEVTIGYNKVETDYIEVEPRSSKNHKKVWNTLPASVQKVLETTDDTEYGEDVDDTSEVETKWVGWLNKDEWEDLKNFWFIEPENGEPTMGMITEYGLMWALSETCDGMDWNVVGYAPLSYMNMYYCSKDPEVMKRAKELGYFGEDE